MVHDHFSKQSAIYKRFRPTYPSALFKWLSSLTEKHELAWDCATGNGQAAKDLALYFNRVIASDISDQQLAEAESHPRIHYVKAPGEHCPQISDHTVDLVIVAQAFHWLDAAQFFTEVTRVLKKEGMLAIWNYDWAEIDAKIDPILNRFGKELLQSYWPEEIKKRAKPAEIVDAGFHIISPPKFNLEVSWDFSQLRGYFDSWSATQIFKEKNNTDPFLQVAAELENAWGDLNSKKVVKWPLYLSVAKYKG